VAATGAEDRESLDKARRNAPLAVLTLDRVVSLQDYEDFARAFAGIAKALATWTWQGQKRGVFVTVAGPEGAPVDRESMLGQNLTAALQKAGEPYVPLAIRSYEPRFFRVSAKIKVHPDYLADKVLAAVAQQLRERFSFDEREFGQPVARSEVIAAMQQVAGVTAVDVDEFYRTDEPATFKPLLAAGMPRPGSKKIVAAELLMLDPQSPDLKIML
jgi:predicted phage baseplate assembly protein